MPHNDSLENCTRKGANRLCLIIEEYWRKRGAKIEALPYIICEHEDRNIWGVRTNLINGLPPNGR